MLRRRLRTAAVLAFLRQPFQTAATSGHEWMTDALTWLILQPGKLCSRRRVHRSCWCEVLFLGIFVLAAALPAIATAPLPLGIQHDLDVLRHLLEQKQPVAINTTALHHARLSTLAVDCGWASVDVKHQLPGSFGNDWATYGKPARGAQVWTLRSNDTCTLIQSESRRVCKRGVSWGCHDDDRRQLPKVWVGHGCRGRFRCSVGSGAAFVCREPKGRFANCTCPSLAGRRGSRLRMLSRQTSEGMGSQ